MQIKTPQELVALIRRVCEAFDGVADKNEVALLLGTAAVESGCKARSQWWNGPARGLWQMEPRSAQDLFKNYLRRHVEIWKKLIGWFPQYPLALYPTQKELGRWLKGDDRFACCLARIYYLSKPEAIPTTLEGQAGYWKEMYNTRLGKGTVKKYLAAWDTNKCAELLA